MRIVSIGGGPAGLYTGILMKKAFPEVEFVVYERNGPDDTFGWGVVFSDESLDQLRAADPETLDEIRANFRYWGDIETYFGGTCVTSTGHGFCGFSRQKLLHILQERAASLGVELHFDHDVTDLAPHLGADLVLAADGVNSFIRAAHEDDFGTAIDWRKAKFCWLGTSKPLTAFTFVFAATEWGVFQAHAYPFEDGLSTWIVECHEDTWRRAGLDAADEAETVRFCEAVFAEQLDGHPLLTNRSIWRTFPNIHNERWSRGNVVLMGDAAHTAHFSIGSGTKLAMESAMALVDAFVEHGLDDVPKVLAAYEEARRPDVIKLQRAAQVSLEWFENSARYMGQHPLQFSFNLMTRSKRITYDNLAIRDPEFVARVADWYREDQGAPLASDGSTPVPLFAPLRVGSLELPNRVVVSPMCQYSAEDGTPNDWHVVHIGSRAVGGAGLVLVEATNVSAEARISPGCTGIYTDEHTAQWKRIVDFAHTHSRGKIGIQLGHAGRKASCAHPWEGHDTPLTEGGWQTLAPSPLPFLPDWPVPKEMDRADMDRVIGEFADATRRSAEAGFDLVELHMAHGYLLNTFISPLSNHREDAYGGSLENRMRFPLEVMAAVRTAWPEDKPLAVRISAVDWVEGGLTEDEAVEVAKLLRDAGCDLLDVSTSGISPDAKPNYGRMFQVPFADRIRQETGMLVMTVGAVLGADHVNTILAAGRADLCALARPHLRQPYLTLLAAADYEYPDQHWPGQYALGKPDRWLLEHMRRQAPEDA